MTQVITPERRTLVGVVPLVRVHVIVRVPTVQDREVVLMVTRDRRGVVVRGPVFPATRDKARDRPTPSPVTLVLRKPGLKGKGVHMIRRKVSDENDGKSRHIPSVSDGVPAPDKVPVPGPPKTKGVPCPAILIATRVRVLLMATRFVP